MSTPAIERTESPLPSERLSPAELFANTVRGLHTFETTCRSLKGDASTRFENLDETAHKFGNLLQDFEVYAAQMGIPQLDTWRAALSHAVLMENHTHGDDTVLGREARAAKGRLDNLLGPHYTSEEQEIRLRSNVQFGMDMVDMKVMNTKTLVAGEHDIKELLEDCDRITQSALPLGIANQQLFRQLAVKLEIISKESQAAQQSPEFQKLLEQYRLIANPQKKIPVSGK